MINWTEQWQQFAANFHDGYAHIDLKPLGTQTILRLKPGPGFGDLSHPTTRLSLALLAKYAPDRTVVDIGSGSGILSLVSALLGAKQCFGIDIEPEAVAHAQENAEINGLKVAFFHAKNPPRLRGPLLIVMNMIHSEQKRAKEMYDELFDQAEMIITSGVLASQREAYLAQVADWELVSEMEEEGWMAFLFKPILIS